MQYAAAAFPSPNPTVQQQQRNELSHIANLITNYGDPTAPRLPPPPFVPLARQAQAPGLPPGQPLQQANVAAHPTYSRAPPASTCPTPALAPRPVACAPLPIPSQASGSSDRDRTHSQDSFSVPTVRWRTFKVDMAMIATLDTPALHSTPQLDKDSLEQDLKIAKGASRALSTATLLIEAAFPDSLASRLRRAGNNRQGLVNLIFKLIHETSTLHLTPKENRAISTMSGRAVPVYLVRAGRLCSLKMGWIKRDRRSRDVTCLIAVKKAGPWSSTHSMYAAFRPQPLAEDLEYYELSRTPFALARLPPRQV